MRGVAFAAVICATVLSFQGRSFGEPEAGDTIDFKTWFSGSLTSTGLGLAERGTIDTVRTSSDGGREYIVMIKAANNTTWWLPTLPTEGIHVRMATSASKPARVEDCSAKFAGCRWLTGVFSTFSFIGNKEFFFPVLPVGQNYATGDFYRVRISDTVGVVCTLATAGSVQVFSGRLLRYSNANDKTGAPISITEPLRLTIGVNPFRFGGIVAHSSAGPYLGMDLTCCGTGYYGLDITGYHPAKPLAITTGVRAGHARQGSPAAGPNDLLGRAVSIDRQRLKPARVLPVR